MSGVLDARIDEVVDEVVAGSDLARGCRAVAAHWLGSGVEERVGRVVLSAGQGESARRVRASIAEWGGALLADEVGSGKTYVALAVAAGYREVLVVGPAVLRGMWREAAERCGLALRWQSFEALSRGAVSVGERPDLVIVDEAHHARTVATRRHRALADLCARAPVLALSATPVHNREGELRAVLALWMGARAFELPRGELAAVVVRRVRAPDRQAAAERAAAGALPEVRHREWTAVADDEPVLDALLALPAPLPPSGGDAAEPLVMMGLVRQWASSEAALRAAIARRLGQSVALEAALERGRHPDRRELAGWGYEAGAVQLAFPELMASAAADASVGALLAAVRAHRRGLEHVRGRLAARRNIDDERAQRLLDIVRCHPGERVVAFSAFGATVAAMFERLVGRVRVAAVDGRGGRIASGALSRDDALRWFSAIDGRAAERVDLLLATDLLSEGVNLQAASVVVHLDLPWTPARLAQRVGRVARLGGHPVVSVYGLAAPVSAARWVDIDRRLREKAGKAARAIGSMGDVLPDPCDFGTSDVERWEAVRRIVAGWQHAALAGGMEHGAGATASDGGAPAAVGVGWGECGGAGGAFVAAVRRARRVELVAGVASEVGTGAALVLRAARAVAETLAGGRVPADGGASTSACRAERSRAGVRGAAIAEVLAALRRWERGERATIDAGLRGAAAAGARRRVLDRIALAVGRAPRQRRAAVAGLAVSARAAAAAAYGVGAERALAALAASGPADDEAWLRAVAAFGTLHRRPGAEDARGGRVALLAVAIVRP